MLCLLALLGASLASTENAEAGQLEVWSCWDGVNNSSSPWNAVAWFGDSWDWTLPEYCSGGGAMWAEWTSTSSINTADIGYRGAAGWTISAPGGTRIRSIRADTTIISGGTGGRCAGFYSFNGSVEPGGPANCRGTNSYGSNEAALDWDLENDVDANGSTRVYMVGECYAGPCQRNPSHSVNYLTALFKNVITVIEDPTNPSLTNGGGLWDQSGSWVRGSWSLSWRATDSIGVKSSSWSAGSGSGSYTNCSVPTSIFGRFYSTTTVPCATQIDPSYSVNTTDIGNGSHTLYINSTDSTGNTATASTTVNVDNTTPTAPLISVNAAAISNDTTPTFEFGSASDPQSGISGYQCQIDSGAWFDCSSPYTSGVLAEGSHTFSTRAKNNAIDSGGSPAIGAAATGSAFEIDTTPPTASFSTQPASPTKANPLVYQIDFSEEITGLTSSDFTFTGVGSSSCVANPTAASGTSITVNVSGCGEGTTQMTLKANSVQDLATNAGPTSPLISGTTTIDRTKPTAYWTEPETPTNALTLAYTLVFSETVSGIDSAIFQNDGTATGCTFSPSNNTGPNLTVYVSGCSDGTVIIKLKANQVSDTAGNTGPSSARIASTVVVDRTGPVGSWTEPSSPNKSATLNYTLTTNENANGMSDSDLEVIGTATGCTVSVTGTSGTSFPVTVSGCSEGTVVVRLKAGSLTDDLGNSGPATNNDSTAVTIDRTPAVASWTAPSSPNKAATLNYTLSFNENISGLASGDFDITGTATGCSASPNASSGTSFTVAVSGCSEGTVILTLKAGSVDDDALNASPAIDKTASTVNIDRTPATASWTEPSSPNKAATLNYTLAFNENISGLSSGDFDISGTATGCAASPDASSGTSFTVAVSGCSEGTVILTLKKESVDDDALNASPASDKTASAVTIDRTPATASWTSEPSSPTKAATLNYTLAFNENVTGLTAADFSNQGSASGCLFAVSENSPDSYDLEVTGCSEGTLIVRLAAGAADDPASNASPASNLDATAITIDRSAAVASWTEPSSPNQVSPLSYTLNFDENVSGLSSSDLENIGTAPDCVLAVSASSGTSFTVTASDCFDGTVILRLKKDSVEDDSGNASPANNSDANSVTFQVKPRNDSSPWINGPTASGQTMGSGIGDWSGTAPMTTGRQWQVCETTDPASCTDLSGETGVNYTPGPDQVGKRIRLVVTADNVVGPTVASSEISSVVGLDKINFTSEPAWPSNNVIYQWSTVVGASSECSIDDGGFEPCSSPLNLNYLNDGQHSLKVRQKLNGQTSPSRESVFRLDKTAPPGPTITEKPADITNQTIAPFRFIGEEGATFECRWEDGVWKLCASPESAANLSLGDHKFSVRQTDLAGNTSDPTVYQWNIVDYDPNNMGDKINPGANKYDPVIIKPDNGQWAVLTCGVNKGTFGVCKVFSYAMLKKATYKRTPYCSKQPNRNKQACLKYYYKYISVGRTTITNNEKLGSIEVKIKLNGYGRSLLANSRGPLMVKTNYRVVLPDGKVLTGSKISYFTPPSQKMLIPTGGRFFIFRSIMSPEGKAYMNKITVNMPRKVKSISCTGYTGKGRDQRLNYRLSLIRAEKVCAYFRSQGIKAKYKSYSRGQTDPRASNKTQRGRNLNKRTMVKIVY